MTGMPRIAYLSLEAPREGQASFVHVREIVEGLRRRDFEVELFIPAYTTAGEPPSLARKLFEYVRIQVALLRRWREYDGIYVRSHFMAFPTGLAARWSNRPIIQEVNGPYIDIGVTHPWTKRVGWLLRKLQLAQYRWASAILPVTEQLKDWLRPQVPDRYIEVVPNGANTDLFNPCRSSAAAPAGRYVVFFGGLARWHGVETMLEAVEIETWPSDVALVVVGDGQMGPLVAAAAARHPLVTWLGRLPYVEVGGIVARALAGLVPINSQGNRGATGMYPLKLFETLACGVPAIVTDYPGQADLVRGGACGVVIPADDAEALSRAVASLANDPAGAREMGQRGAAIVRERYSWDARAGQVAEVLWRLFSRDGKHFP